MLIGPVMREILDSLANRGADFEEVFIANPANKSSFIRSLYSGDLTVEEIRNWYDVDRGLTGYELFFSTDPDRPCFIERTVGRGFCEHLIPVDLPEAVKASLLGRSAIDALQSSQLGRHWEGAVIERTVRMNGRDLLSIRIPEGNSGRTKEKNLHGEGRRK